MTHIGSPILLLIACTALSAQNAPAPSAASESPTSQSCIDIDITVKAPLADVWRAWTTNAGAQEFFCSKAEIEPHPGGSYNILFMPDNEPGKRGAEGQKVLSVLPMEMLSFDWGAPPQFAFARAHPGWVVVQFNPVDESHTHVRLVHLGFDHLKATYPHHAEEFDQTRDYFSKAWPYVLGNLKRRFDEGPRWDAQGKLLWKE